MARDALRRHRAEPEAHRTAQDRHVVVLRREDEGVGETHAAHGRREPRIVVPEDGHAIEGHEAQRPLSERDGLPLGETAEDAVVEDPVQRGERGGHAAKIVAEDSTPRRGLDDRGARLYR